MNVNSKGKPFAQRPNPIGLVSSGIRARESATEAINFNQPGRVAEIDREAQRQKELRRIASNPENQRREVRRPEMNPQPRTEANATGAGPKVELLNRELQLLKSEESDRRGLIETLKAAVQAMPSWEQDVTQQIAQVNSEIADLRVKIAEAKASIEKNTTR